MKSVVLTRREELARKRRPAILDYASTFLSTGLIQGIGIITGILTARLLGPAGKGDLTTVFWLPGLMTEAGILALPQAVAFEVSRHPEHDEALTAAGFWLSLGLGMIEAAILYPLIPYILGPNKQHLISISRWFLLYLPIVFSGLTLLGIDRGRQAFVRYNLLRLLPAVLYVVGLLVLWGLGKANVITTIVLTNLVAQLITSGTRASAAGGQLFPRSLPLWFKAGKQVLNRGFLFHLPTLTGIILMRTDMALLIRMVSAEEVGYYSVAMAIAMAQIGVATSLVQVNFPKVAAYTSQEAIDVMLRQFRLAQPVVVGVASVMALASPWIIQYLFGVAFLPAVLPALILIAALALWGLSQILDNGLRAMGYGMPGIIANGIGLVILIVCGILLVKLSGIKGMAITMLVSQIGVFGSLLVVCHWQFSVELRNMWGFSRTTFAHLISRTLSWR